MENSEKLRPGENLFTWLMMAFSIIILVLAYRISGFSSVSSPGMFPMAAAAVMIISMAFILFGNRKREKTEASGFKEEMRHARKLILPPVFLIYTGIIIIYMVIIQPLHFLPSSFGFLLVSMIYLKGTGPVKALLVSMVSMACIYFIFHYFFRVVLP